MKFTEFKHLEKSNYTVPHPSNVKVVVGICTYREVLTLIMADYIIDVLTVLVGSEGSTIS